LIAGGGREPVGTGAGRRDGEGRARRRLRADEAGCCGFAQTVAPGELREHRELFRARLLVVQLERLMSDPNPL
jgi:hypothetical protein